MASFKDPGTIKGFLILGTILVVIFVVPRLVLANSGTVNSWENRTNA
ncbi:MAG: hypothetical protein ACRD4Q_04330 [Candidatus Acidiferrales bacterium]